MAVDAQVLRGRAHAADSLIYSLYYLLLYLGFPILVLLTSSVLSFLHQGVGQCLALNNINGHTFMQGVTYVVPPK